MAVRFVPCGTLTLILLVSSSITVCSAPVMEKAVMTGACGACSIMVMVYLRVAVSVNLMVNVLAIEKSIESVNKGVTEMGVIPAGY